MIVAARAMAPGHAWLSAPERARLQRMGPVRGAEFTTGRVLARALVAAATARAPAAVTIAVRPPGDPRAGMPWIPDAAGGISIAHSGGVVLVAYRPEGEVGVDLEAGICRASPLALPASEGTSAAVGGAVDAAVDAVADYLPVAERPHTGWTPATLATAWVRREAVVKCLGVGLVPAPEHLTLAPADAAPAVVACALAPAARLALVDLDVGGVPGALAMCTRASSIPDARALGIPPSVPEIIAAADLVGGADNVAIRLSASAAV